MFDIPVHLFLYAGAAAMVAGMIKGAVGFAMPMVMISSLAMVFDPKMALGLLIMPTLVSNAAQALRQGLEPVKLATRRFAPFLIVGGLCLLTTAQLVTVLSQELLVLIVGVSVLVFAAFQLSGWLPQISPSSKSAQVIAASVAGSIGGVSGIWGPPTVAYLTAINTPKVQQMQVQGVIYGLGAVGLLVGHVQSGIVNPTSMLASSALVLPALIGLWLGFKVQDRVDQAQFRKLTLIILMIGGLNLIRRGSWG